MAAGSPVGHIGLWDLEEKKLLGQMRDTHSTAVSGMSFVQGEPLLITNGSDNAIRVSCAWFFILIFHVSAPEMIHGSVALASCVAFHCW